MHHYADLKRFISNKVDLPNRQWSQPDHNVLERPEISLESTARI